MSVEIEENALTLSVEVRELEAPTLLNDVDMARWFDEEVFEGSIRFNEALGWHQMGWQGLEGTRQASDSRRVVADTQNR